MADLSAVRTEIKTWERTFKSIHGRDPSIQDIRQQPAIEEKYKRYKKLSKAVAAGTTSFSLNCAKYSHPPSTPPKPQRRDAQAPVTLLFSKPRAIEQAAPLSSFNPFSPQKNKGKQKEQSLSDNDLRLNPFAQAKVKPLVRNRSASPEPFPRIQVHRASTSNFVATPPQSAPTSAISRARKRLRGDPVSPSPNKEKRRRYSPPTIHAKFAIHQQASEDTEDTEAANSYFVDDSPVKAPAGGKSFKVLFEETVAPQNVIPGKTRGRLARSKTIPASLALFGGRSDISVSTKFDDGLDSDLRIRSRLKYAGTNKSISLSFPVPTKDDLFSGNEPSTNFQLVTASQPSKADPSSTDSRTSKKRSLSDTEAETGDILASTTHPTPSLLPPSPPPADSSSHRVSATYNVKGKGGTRTKTAGRKKAKVVNDDDDDDEGADKGKGTNVNGDEVTDGVNHNVKLVDRTHIPGIVGEETPDLDLDPILGYARRGLRIPHGNLPPTQPGPTTEYVSGSRTGTFEVDLPEKLRRVLALSPSQSKARDSTEDKVFRRLLYGRRTSHYDPVKGGEIWDVGEEERCNRDGEGREEGEGTSDGENDWEGEPVPWEVGEL